MSTIDFQIGLSGLTVAQSALQTIGHNIANMNTPGYNRQIPLISSREPSSSIYGPIGTGVTIQEIRRVKDELLDSQINSTTSLLGDAKIQSESFKTMEVFFNELSETGLSNRIDTFFQGLQDLSTNPELSIIRNQVFQDSQNMVTAINGLEGRFTQLKAWSSQQIESKVVTVNGLTSQIAELNKRVTAIELSQGLANDSRDKRDALVRELSNFADVIVQNNPNGSINVLMGGTMTVVENIAVEISTTVTGQGEVTINGMSAINSGELKGLLDIQNITIPKYIQKLDTLSASIVSQINNIHSKGIGLDGGFTNLASTNEVTNSTDLLSNTGLQYPPSVTTYTTGRVTSTDNADGTSTVTGVGTTFTSNAKIDDWIEFGGTYYRVLAVDSDDTRLTISGGVTSSAYTGGSIAGVVDNGDNTSTVTGALTTFNTDAEVNDWIDIGGTFYQISAVNSDTDLTISSGVTSAGVATNIVDGTNMTSGNLHISVIDSSGEITISNISVASEETLNTFSAKLNAVTNLNTSINNGFLTITSDNGYSFHFTRGLDSNLGAIGGAGSPTVSLHGDYTGSDNDIYTLTVTDNGTGRIGTGNATIRVTDASGKVVSDLDVGASYTPTTALNIGNGVSVSFSNDMLTVSDTMSFDVINDSDTSNILAALGMNTFFQGNTASSIGLSQFIIDDVSRIAAASTNSQGDNTNILRMLDLQNSATTSGSSFGGFLHSAVAELGVETAQKESEKDSFDSLNIHLSNRREEVSGVSIDEEMINSIRFQQLFQASAKYISTLSEIGKILMNI